MYCNNWLEQLFSKNKNWFPHENNKYQHSVRQMNYETTCSSTVFNIYSLWAFWRLLLSVLMSLRWFNSELYFTEKLFNWFFLCSDSSVFPARTYWFGSITLCLSHWKLFGYKISLKANKIILRLKCYDWNIMTDW